MAAWERSAMQTKKPSFIKSETGFQLMFERHPIPLWIHERGTCAILEINPAMARRLGFSQADLLQKTLQDLIFIEERPRFTGLVNKPELAGHIPGQWHLYCKNGSVLSAELDFQPFGDPVQGLVLGTLVEKLDPTKDRNILEARLRLSEFAYSHTLDELLQKTLDEAERLTNSQIGFFHFVEADQITLWLQTWSTNTLQNMCTAEGKGSHYNVNKAGVWVECVYQRRPVIHNDYAALPHRKGLPAGHAPVIRELVVPVMRNDVVVAILGVGNKPTLYDADDVMTVSLLADLAWDITGKKRAEYELNESEQKFRGIFTQSPIAIELYDARGSLINANPACLKLFGVTDLEHVLGFNLLEDPNLSEDTRLRLARGELVAYESIFDFDLVKEKGLYPTNRSGIFYINCIIRPLIDFNREITGYLVHAYDVTERKLTDEELLQAHTSLKAANLELHQALAREQILARTDSLTGIYNRRHFFEVAGHEFQVTRRYQSPLSIILFDIDHFKALNDSFGHQIGDEILRQVAHITRQQLRDADIFARYGGEEFIILLPNSSAQESETVSHRFLKEIAAFFIETERGRATTTVSVGIAEYTPDMETLDQLIQHADTAMYAAKQAGRNRSVVYA